MRSTVEIAKSLLTNTEIITKIVMTEHWRDREEKDNDTPESFWKIKRYEYRIDMETLKRPKDEDWTLVQSFETAKLPEAVAHCILGSVSKDKFVEVPLPPRLMEHWSRYEIQINESISSKTKWDEIRIDRRANVTMYETFNGKTIECHADGRFNMNYLLTEIPSIFTQQTEGLPYGFKLSEMLQKNPVDRFPYFLYKGHVFRSTHYVTSQKCMCGESDTFYNDYEEDNTIKVEITSIDRFFQEDEIYIEKTNIYFNGQTLQWRDKSTILIDTDKKNIKQLFPTAKYYHSDMCAGPV